MRSNEGVGENLMSDQENIQVVRRLFNEFNAHNIDAGFCCFHENILTLAAGTMGVMNKAQTIIYLQQFLNAFPNLHFEIQDIVAQAGLVTVTWLGQGRHSGLLKFFSGKAIPATYQSIEIPGCSVLEFQQGKIVYQKIYWDTATLMVQLGLIHEFAQLPVLIQSF